MSDVFEVKVAVLADPASARIAELQGQLNELTKTKEINIKLNIDKSSGISSIAKEIDSLGKKLKTSLSEKAIAPQIPDISKQSTQLDNINRKYRELKEAGVDASSSVGLLNQAFKNLEGAKNIDDSKEALVRFDKALAQFDAQLSTVKEDFKDLIPKNALDVSSLSNKIEVWAKNNARAAKEFANQLREVNQLLSGEKVSTGDYQKADKMFKDLTSSAKAMGIEGESAGEKFGKMFAKFGQWFGITRIIMEVVNAMKQMVSTTIELDGAINNIRMITGASGQESKELLRTYQQLASQIGSTTSEVVASSDVWLNFRSFA